MTRIRIVIPAHNEAKRIEPCLRDFCEYFGERAVVVVVANGCTDDTAAVVGALLESHNNLQLIDIPARIGKGGAVRAGLKTGDEEWIGFVDADHSFTASDYDRMWLSASDAHADGVIASRYLPGSMIEPPASFVRSLASRSFNQLVHITLGMPYTDTQCGAKIFRIDLLRRLFANLTLANFAFDIDLLYAAHRAGARIVEFPIRLSDRVGSTIRLLPTSIRMATALLRLRLEHSVVSRLPYFEYLAADALIPMHRMPSVLFLEDPGAVKDGMTRAVLERAGYRIETPPLWPGATTRIARLGRRFYIIAWYVLGSHRRYDAIVESESTFPFLLPLLSVKRLYVLRNEVRRSRFAAMIYRRYRKVRYFCDAAKLAADLRYALIRRAAFEPRGDDGWLLHYTDRASDGSLETIELR